MDVLDVQPTQYHPSISVPSRETYPLIIEAKMRPSFGGWMGSLILICMVTISTVSAALTAFVFCLRPALKTFEETCKAAELASKQLETAAISMEEASIMFDEQLPPALKSVEAASKEFEELGQSLNSLSGGLLSRRPARHRRREHDRKDEQTNEQETSTSLVSPSQDPTKNKSTSGDLTRQTMVASDITSFTHKFRPAMDMWRQRLTNIVSTVEAGRGSKPESTTVLQKQLEEPATDVAGVRVEAAVNGIPPAETRKPADDEGTSSSKDSKDDMDYGDLLIRDIFKDKDSLIARLSSESTGDAASAIMDALYKAEQAAEEATRASDDLEEAVEKAWQSGEWEGIIAWGDDDSAMAPKANEFFDSDVSGSIRYDVPPMIEEEATNKTDAKNDNVE